MAASPIDQSDFAPVDDVGFIAIDQIEMGERMRLPDLAWAEALGLVMAREGQRTPIEVCKPLGSDKWVLVSGAHRLLGARLAGITQLKAIVCSANDLDRKRAEVSENLWRRDLDPLDRAECIAQLVDIERARAGIHPNEAGRAQSARVMHAKKALKAEAADATRTMTVAFGFTEKVAESIGLSVATVFRDLQMYRGICREVIDRLRNRNHPVLKNAAGLRAIAKLDPVEQSKVASWLLFADAAFGAPAKSVAEAIGRLDSRKRPKSANPGQDKAYQSFISSWGRLDRRSRESALEYLADRLPKGWRLMREGENAQ